MWIIDTPKNRQWFNAQPDRQPQSATFSIERYSTMEDAVMQMIWNAQEQSPDWDTIDVSGVTAPDRVTDALAAEGRVLVTATGFSVDSL